MAKQVQSWSKPDGITNLIARKKVDYSIFSPGSIYISRLFKDDFVEANNGEILQDSEVEKLILVINNKEFAADLRCNFSPNVKGERQENLQIRYDANSKLKNLLIKEFAYSYQYIRNEQKRSGKTSVKLPDDVAEYIEFYKTETPFKYNVKIIKSSAQMMGYPLRNIFNDVEEVKWTFSFIRKMLLGVGIEDSDSESFSITLPDNQNSIHVNFQAWRLFAIKKRENARLYIELAYKDKYAQSRGFQRIFDFKQLEDEESIGIYNIDFLEMKENQNTFIEQLRDTWDTIKNRFFNQKKTQYYNNNIKDLADAIFDDVILDYIIENGIDENNDHDEKSADNEISQNNKTNVWIFQANPKFYDIEGALSKINIISWSVNQYKKKIKKGDKVYIWVSGKESGLIAVGEILSNPSNIQPSTEDLTFYISNEKKQNNLRVNISIIKKFSQKITKNQLLNHPILRELKIIAFPNATNYYVTSKQEEAMALLFEGIRNESVYSRELESIIPIHEKVNEIIKLNPDFSIEQCAESLGIDEDTIERWVRAIERKGQAILYGPPGTGKTFAAHRFSELILSGGDGIVETIQFHPAYAYEDFIIGIRPVTENGILSYKQVEGRFINFCNRCRERKGNCVLIIDEVNRANLSRVFGELMYLLEYKTKSIPLANGELFSIPSNVYIIGTMNTADRSIAIVDHALRRRFAFLEMNINYDVLRNFHKNSKFKIDKLISWLIRVNQAIDDKRYFVGISFFLRENLSDDIQDIWSMEIMPYLEEYFFDQPEKVKEFSWERVEDSLS